MNIVLLLVLIISIWGIRLRKDDIEGHMSPKQTAAINGIFVMFVFLRHFGQNIDFGEYDKILRMVDNRLGQMLVSTFLFYSGYGIMYSIINKNNYIKSLPQRFLKLLIQFDIAVLLFLTVDLILGYDYSIKTILLAFIGWTSIGNSNWYIFAMLCLYLITFISGIICKKNHFLLIVLVTIGCAAYIVLLHMAGKPQYCYDTILCFPVGLLYGLYIKGINIFLRSKKIIPAIYILISLMIFAGLYICEKKLTAQMPHLALLELKNISFAIIFVALTTLLVIGNRVLNWLGKYVFEIYILQRIPMMVFKNVITNKYIYFTICLILTIIVSPLLKMLLSLIYKRIFNPRNNSNLTAKANSPITDNTQIL
ncbi:MAG: acyltransferase [Lachnospiraceae bacterium]|nr:acyltransferase [Lachnospiraceae bacterium]